MDQLAEMRVFVCAIERGAFAAAARDLGLTPSAVSKLVTRLERRLGVRLVNRTTRRLSLTPEGEAYFRAGRRIVEAVDGLESEVAASAERPQGLLRVGCGLAMGRHLAAALVRFQAQHPAVRVDLSATDRVVDLHADQIDVAVRTGAQRDSTLMVRKLADLHRVICASPAYIERHGVPREPADLAHHRCIVISGAQRLDRWPFDAADGGIETVQVAGALSTDSSDCALQFALAGAGILRLGHMFVTEAIQRGDLVPLLVDRHRAEAVPISAVFPPGTQKIPRVRAFLDFLAAWFGATAAR